MRAFAVGAVTEPPYPARMHPHRAAAAARSLDWAAALGLTPTDAAARRLAAANAAELAARACPAGPPTALHLLTDLVTWLFAFDDGCDESELGTDPARLGPVVARLLTVLDRQGAGKPAGSPVEVALHDLCGRLRATRRPALLLRFGAQLREYLLALLWEAGNRLQGRVPGVAEYVQLRRHTGAALASFTVTDLAAATVAPGARHRSDPRWARLDALAADLVCWCNDLFSYAKEDDGHNLAAVIAHARGCDERTALVEAAHRFTARLAEYARVETGLLADGGAAARGFAETRRCWIRGTYDWSVHTVRYV